MHQLVEYVIGVLLVSQGLQAAEPAIPTLIGAAVLANAAIAKGPLAAFPKVPRAIHRIADLVLLVATAVAACLPGSIVDTSTRVILIGVGAVFAYVVWKTDYREKPRRASRLRRAAAPTAPTTSPPTSATPATPASSSGPAVGQPGPAAEAPRRPTPSPGFDSEQIGRAAGRTAGKLYNAARRRKRS